MSKRYEYGGWVRTDNDASSPAPTGAMRSSKDSNPNTWQFGYWQCSHQGCQKKARLLEADGHDHDCCGHPRHDLSHEYAQMPDALYPPTPGSWGEVLRAVVFGRRKR